MHKARSVDILKWIEVDSMAALQERQRDEKEGKKPALTEILKFNGTNQMSKRTYADTVVYTAEPGALVRLSRDFISGVGWDNVPGGYLQINNIDVLLKRMAKVVIGGVRLEFPTFSSYVKGVRSTKRTESELECKRRKELEMKKKRATHPDRNWVSRWGAPCQERRDDENLAEQLASATLNETAADLKPEGSSEGT